MHISYQLPFSDFVDGLKLGHCKSVYTTEIRKVLQSQAFFDLEIQMLNIYQHTAGLDKWQYA